jgi:serine/threonine protein kinase
MVMRLGNYLLLERLNQGGMADVFFAKSFGFSGANQTLAVKCIRPEIAEDPVFVRMFVDEAKLAVLLVHANIAQTYEFGRIGGTYFMALEYVIGRNIREIIDRARLRGVEIPEPLVLGIVAHVCEGLDYAHRKPDPTGQPLNIVHRDVSPQNILVSYGGEVKVIDFGIAKAANHVSKNQAGVLRGKYGYMSPEQVRGLSVDHRSDVFAAGVVFWELLTRERLFPGSSDFSILEKVRHCEIYPPTLVMPKVDPEVEAIVMRALARDPADRFSSASDLHDAVVSIMLRRFGQPNPRELGTLMQSLFAAEQQESQRLQELARRYERMPEGVPSLALPEPAAPPAKRMQDASTAPGSRRARASSRRHLDEDKGLGVVKKPSKTPARGPARGLSAEDTPVTGPPEAMSGPEVSAGSLTAPSEPSAAVVDSGRAVPTQVRRVFHQRLQARDVGIVVAALLIAVATIGLTWWLTRPPPGPVRGGVVVLSVPEGAEVLVDEVVVGETPFSSSTLNSGAHTLLVRKHGWQAQSQELEIVPHRVVEVRLTLQPAR